MSKKRVINLMELKKEMEKEAKEALQSGMDAVENREYDKFSPAPCPFCGEYDAVLTIDDRQEWNTGEVLYAVSCKTCEAQAPFTYSEESAWDCWNRRGRMSPLAAQEH